MKTDYENQRKTIAGTNGGAKVLLHSCCAPCSTTCLSRLVPDFAVTVFYYNPNMSSEEEYARRAEEQRRFLYEAYGNKVPLVTEKYFSGEFYSAIKNVKNFADLPEGGARCEECFKLRLSRSAEYAKENGFEYFTTTLTLSPHKNAELLNKIGCECGEKYGVKWLPCDFKKQNGFLLSCKLSNKYGLYRQNFCGCVYSEAEAKARESSRGKENA